MLGESDGNYTGQVTADVLLKCSKVLVKVVSTDPFGAIVSGSSRSVERALLALSSILLQSNVSMSIGMRCMLAGCPIDCC